MNIKLFKSVLINSCLFVAMMMLYFYTGLMLGYAAGDGHIIATWVLFGGFVIVHLLINLLLITKPGVYKLSTVLISTVFILMLYGIMAYIYR